MEDDRILSLLEARDENAIRLAEEAYGKRLRSIAKGITGSREDAEECVSDALFSVWNAIPPAKPESLYAYLARTVRNLALHRVESGSAQKRAARISDLGDELEEILPSANCVEDELRARQIMETVGEALSEESAEARYFFVRRYFYGDSVEKIAFRAGKLPHAVTVSLSRTRKKLKKCLKERGF